MIASYISRKFTFHQSEINTFIQKYHIKIFLHQSWESRLLGQCDWLSLSSQTLWSYSVLKHWRNLYGCQSVFCIATLIQFTLSLQVWSSAFLCYTWVQGRIFMTLESWCLWSWLLIHTMQPFPSKVLPPSEIAVTEYMWTLLRGLIDLFSFSSCVSAFQKASSLLSSWTWLPEPQNIISFQSLWGWGYKMLTVCLRRSGYREDIHMLSCQTNYHKS